MRVGSVLAVWLGTLLLPVWLYAATDHFSDLERVAGKIRLTPAENAWLASHATVRVRVGSWPPFMYTEGGISGIAIDYLNLVSKLHGITFAYITESEMSWQESLDSIARHRGVDLIPAIQPTTSRKEQMLFTDVYQSLLWIIVTRQDADTVEGLTDISGRTLSIQNNFILHSKLREEYPGIFLDVVTTRTPTLDSLRRVALGQSFATVNALPVAVHFMRHYGLSNLKIAAPANFPDLELAMGVRDDWPELVGIINKTFAALTPEDRVAILESWGAVEYDYGVAPGKVKWWGAGIAGTALLGMLLLYVGNRALKRKVDEHTRVLRRELAEKRQVENALRDSLREKDVLLREIHHRVKNNLQIISSLLHLGEISSADADTEARGGSSANMLRDCRTRVVSMALVHDELYRSDNLAVVEFTGYVRKLAGKIHSAMGGLHSVSIDVSGDDVSLDIDHAIPCGLIVTELITNAYKHAFSSAQSGVISVFISKEKHLLRITVADNGRGLPRDFALASVHTLGLTLVGNLAEQVKGCLEVRSEEGTAFTLRVPLPKGFPKKETDGASVCENRDACGEDGGRSPAGSTVCFDDTP